MDIIALATIAALRSYLDAGSGYPVIWIEGYANLADGGEGMFVYNPSDTTSLDNTGTVIVTSNGSRYYREYGKRSINLLWFGADGTGASDSSSAINNWYTFLTTKHALGYVPAGTYLCASPIVFDANIVRTTGITIFGDGTHNSVFTSTVTDGPAFLFECSGGTSSSPIAAFYSGVRDIGFTGNLKGILDQIGKPDQSDQLNEYDWNISAANGNSGSSVIGVQINSNYNCDFKIVANCGGSNGDAIQLTQVQFSTFKGSDGNANNALHITGGYTYANSLQAMDLEASNYCLTCDTATGTTNTFYNGQFAWNTNGLNISAGYASFFDSNFANGGATLFAGTSAQKVLIKGASSGVPFATSSFPASGASVTNTTGRTVSVSVYEGTVRTIVANGNTMTFNSTTSGIMTVTLNPGQAITVDYTGSPSWTWQPLF